MAIGSSPPPAIIPSVPLDSAMRSRRLGGVGVLRPRRHADGTFAVRDNEFNDFAALGHALPTLAGGVCPICQRIRSEEDRAEGCAKRVDVIARQASPLQSDKIESLESRAVPPN